MFIDEKFECATIPEVRKELFQNQKFKTKYPWRTEYKSKVKVISALYSKDDKFNIYAISIRKLLEVGTKNEKTQRFFGLSWIDQLVAACVLSNDYEITTGDKDLIDFMKQEFA
ncbi:MAG: hypothetical protein RQ824_11630 [bacterium]|nr:hypothetical protein [bacterium]